METGGDESDEEHPGQKKQLSKSAKKKTKAKKKQFGNKNAGMTNEMLIQALKDKGLIDVDESAADLLKKIKDGAVRVPVVEDENAEAVEVDPPAEEVKPAEPAVAV